MTHGTLRASGAFLLAAILALALLPTGAAPALAADRGKLINVNEAGVEELMELPGIGRAYAQRIIDYREENGPFRKVEDLLNVRGIGEKTFERIRNLVTIGRR
ncbi:MAG: ComEA family DNA-binding protein [Acidobacteriota bacterium]